MSGRSALMRVCKMEISRFGKSEFGLMRLEREKEWWVADSRDGGYRE